jgi:hypothetical protein
MASVVEVDVCLVFALVDECRKILPAIAGRDEAADRNAVTVDAVATQAAITITDRIIRALLTQSPESKSKADFLSAFRGPNNNGVHMEQLHHIFISNHE